MNTSPKPITVIVFAREPEPGKTKTRLASRIGADSAALLANAFLLDTLSKVAELGLPVLIAADTPRGVKNSAYFLRLAKVYGAALIDQSAGGLGVRMSDAVKPYAQNSSEILIGSDVPSLPLGHLKRAVELMARYNVVLGPTLDGGYYLLGVREPLPAIFHGIRWGEWHVLDETLRRLRAARYSYALAPGWYDVDHGDALAILVAQLFGHDPSSVSLNRSLPLDRGSPCPATVAMLARLGIRHPADL